MGVTNKRLTKKSTLMPQMMHRAAIRQWLSVMIVTVLLYVPALPAFSGLIDFDESVWSGFDGDNVEGGTKPTEFDVDDWNENKMKIKSYGTYISSSVDEYAAYYQTVSGDFEAWVKITDQFKSDDRPKAGLMVRNDISSPGSSEGYVIMSVSGAEGFYFEWDSGSDSDSYIDSSSYKTPMTVPCWLKIIKSGTTFTGYYGKDIGLGTIEWTQVGSATISTAATAQEVGIFNCALDTDRRATSFENFNLVVSTSSVTTYTITYSSGSNGTVLPDEVTDSTGSVAVTAGANQVFNITPDTGYIIDTVTVDGTDVTLSGTTQYTFTSVADDHSIEATFSIATNTITASAGANGSISPSGSVSVNYGDTQTFTVTADTDYEVATFMVDGLNATLSGSTYTFTDVTDNHTVSVTFQAVSSEDEEEEEDEEEDDDETTSGTPGCYANLTEDYSAGFTEDAFDLNNVTIDSDGYITLDTGNDGIDPNNIIIPFEQEVSVTFIYEGAGYVSDFGYILKKDAVNADGTFKGWNSIDKSNKHPIFIQIEDGAMKNFGGDGVFDTAYGAGSFDNSSEAAIEAYDDGSGLSFVTNGDGVVSVVDMKKNLGTFAAGTEIIFFLASDTTWTTGDVDSVLFTKKEWNPDEWNACSLLTREYPLGTAVSEGDCNNITGWLDEDAYTRMSDTDTGFGITLSGTYTLTVATGSQFDHAIVGAPADDPNQWILGIEDMAGGGDADFNDLVFRIERKTGGVATLQSDDAIVPADENAYFTAIEFEVYDYIPNEDPCTGMTDITYYLSIEGGADGTWIEIQNWDLVEELDDDGNRQTDADPISDWTPGNPEKTYRYARIDFAEIGRAGREFVWKAVLTSENEACSPTIYNTGFDASVVSTGNYSRAKPITLANMIYAGSYETPAMTWTDRTTRGHLTATRLYDPEDTTATSEVFIWDAGEELNNKAVDNRVLYFPATTVTQVTDESVGTGDGTTTTFSSTLAHSPVLATTVRITDSRETFKDLYIDELTGTLGGTGSVNRSNGVYSVTFNSPPDNGTPITVSYSYYVVDASASLNSFMNTSETTNVTNALLALNDEYLIGSGYTYDLDKDGDYDQDDGDWLVNWTRGYRDGVSTRKEWLLGPIDHSVPAVQTPPTRPLWYYGTAIADDERSTFDTFIASRTERRTVVYVGARDGMIHAFDGGEFRYGDNTQTTATELRGYFLWETDSEGNTAPNYGTGEELWAFIPVNLLPRMKNNYLLASDQSYVDASPTLADVYLDTDADGTPDTWKTILISAEGNGGDTVFCLDVTDPDSPSFMWEYGEPELFRSRSSPSVGKIGRILVAGRSKWVTFFVTGKAYTTGVYPAVYIVDIETGTLMEKVVLDEDEASTRGIDGIPSGQPAIIDSDGNGYADRAYIGTDKGYMYKVNLPDDPESTKDYEITHCVINTDFEYTDSDGVTYSIDAGQQFHSIYSTPAVIVDNEYNGTDIDYNIKIFFGTSDSPYTDENIVTEDTRYHFFAYIDHGEKGDCTPGNVELSWYLELPAGERVFASAFAAAGSVYFGTSTAETEDPCDADGDGNNDGKLYGFTEDGTPITALAGGLAVGNITSGLLVSDEHLYYNSGDGVKSLGSGSYNNAVQMSGGGSEVNARTWRIVE